VYAAPVDHARWHEYTHNVHLTESLRLERPAVIQRA